jgi:hypothetical protein
MAHKHADKMMEFAKDAAKHDLPWLFWEHKNQGFNGWISCTKPPEWKEQNEYRRKPETQWGGFKIESLSIGDRIQHKLTKGIYIVTGNYGTRATAVRTVDVSSEYEWEKLSLNNHGE